MQLYGKIEGHNKKMLEHGGMLWSTMLKILLKKRTEER